MIGRNVRYIASIIMSLALAIAPISVSLGVDAHAAPHDGAVATVAVATMLHAHAESSEDPADCSEMECCGICSETMVLGANVDCAIGSCLSTCPAAPAWFGERVNSVTVAKTESLSPPAYALGRPILGLAPPHGPPKA